MLDFLGTVATAALIVFVISTLLVFMEASRGAKLWLAALLGLWVGIAAAALATAWPAARRAMLSLSLPLLVGLNIGRVFAVEFLILAGEGRLSGPFPHSAGWGDIITGVVALLLLRLARDPARHRTVLHLWNAFGMLDLITAIGLGVMSATGSPLQIFAGPGSEAMQHLPWSFVPTVLVPLWMILHAIIWVKLRRA
jgi:hypothetical protein